MSGAQLLDCMPIRFVKVRPPMQWLSIWTVYVACVVRCETALPAPLRSSVGLGHALGILRALLQHSPADAACPECRTAGVFRKARVLKETHKLIRQRCAPAGLGMAVSGHGSSGVQTSELATQQQALHGTVTCKQASARAPHAGMRFGMPQTGAAQGVMLASSKKFETRTWAAACTNTQKP